MESSRDIARMDVSEIPPFRFPLHLKSLDAEHEFALLR